MMKRCELISAAHWFHVEHKDKPSQTRGVLQSRLLAGGLRDSIESMRRALRAGKIVIRAARNTRRKKRPDRRRGLASQLGTGVVKLRIPLTVYDPSDRMPHTIKSWVAECPNETAARYVLEHVRKALLELDGLVVLPADQADDRAINRPKNLLQSSAVVI